MSSYQLGLYEKAMPSGMTFLQMLSAAKRSGYDFLEMSVDETDAKLARLDWTQDEREALLRDMSEAGLAIRSICLSGHRKYPLGSRDASIRARSAEIFRKAVRLADDLGVRVIQLAGYDVYYEQGGEDTRALFEQGLARGVDYAAQYGVTLGFETMETPFMDTVAKAMEYVRRIDSPYLGVYPDLGNLTNAAKLYGGDVYADLALGRGRFVAMHLKETLPGQYRDLDFGAGHVDFVRGAQCARENGVRRFVTEFWHDGREDWQARLTRTCAYARGVLDAAFAGTQE